MVGTPGRLWELHEDPGEEHIRLGLPTLRYIVLDEADRSDTLAVKGWSQGRSESGQEVVERIHGVETG